MQWRDHGVGLALVAFAAGWACLIGHSGVPEVRAFADFLSGIFHTTYLVVVIPALIVLSWRGRGVPSWGEVAAVMLGQMAAVHTLKFATGKLLGIFPRPSGNWGGFPSGHTADMVALAFLLTEWAPRLGILWYSLAAAVAWSRRETDAHFGYQIVAGALLGLAFAWGNRRLRLRNAPQP